MLIVPMSAVSLNVPDESIQITLERGMCFGTCPVYTVSLSGNGTIFFEGRQFVETEGNVTNSIDPQTVADLFHSLNTDGFFYLNDSYSAYEITDMPSATLTVRNSSINKSVYHYYGDSSAPQTLMMMEDAVDLVANTSRWIGNGSFIGWDDEIL
ncbi:DUF6438 domain-containing protein [Methanospirillum stamsii]|nr:DUF6438 domain-containing protein [Methanospirillum stamsii]